MALHKCTLLISSCFLSNSTLEGRRKYDVLQTKQLAECKTACRTMAGRGTAAVRCSHATRVCTSLHNHVQTARSNRRDHALSRISRGHYFWFHALCFSVKSMSTIFDKDRNIFYLSSRGVAGEKRCMQQLDWVLAPYTW